MHKSEKATTNSVHLNADPNSSINTPLFVSYESEVNPSYLSDGWKEIVLKIEAHTTC